MNKNKFSFCNDLNQNVKIVKIFLWALMLAGFILLIDIYDMPSNIIQEIPVNAMIVFIGVIVVAVVLAVYNSCFWNLCRFPQVNLLDVINLCAMFVSMICGFAWKFWINQYIYKRSVALALCMLFMVFFVVRCLYIKRSVPINIVRNNIYDLRDIYEGQVLHHSQTPIFVSETDVDYDLLNRSGIINVLYRSIIAYKSNSAFVIGLEGEWGSGKTTIINNVKRKLKDNENVIIIDNFDPWIYGTQNALLMAMYDSILRETGVRYSIYHEKRILKSLSNLLVNSYSAGNIVQNLLFSQRDDYDEAQEILKRLKQYVERTNKTIVFFVDNMDRAEGSNIIFLLKLIGTVFRFPNIIYVLSYEGERLHKILEDTMQINPKYVEKIINQEVKVPLLQEEQLKEVYGTCISNLLESYGMEKEEILSLCTIEEIIFEKVKDLRMFKRMINSVFVGVFCQENYLYKRDLLGLEVMRFIRPKLYSEINENKIFFISHDRIIDRYISHESMDKKKFNSEGKTFFAKLFSEHGKFKNLLAEMFPYVKQFMSGNALQSEYIGFDTSYKDISKNMRICSAKYFGLYFSYGSNEYLKIGKEISDMINEAAEIKDDSQFYHYMCDKIINIPKDAHREWFERLESSLDLVSAPKKIILAKSIFSCLNKINASRVFMGLDAQSRALLCIELLLEKIEVDKIQEFADEVILEYDKLYMIDQILYWFQSTRSSDTDGVKRRENILKESFSIMCEKVIDEKINIYADSYYVQYNIWGLIRYLKIKENREEVVRNYIAQIINEENIYRVIGDMISQSIGNSYGYKISDKNFGVFFKDTTLLDSILQKVVPKTQSEKFVLEVYEKYKGDEANEWGDKEVIRKEEVLLKL